LGGKSDVGQAVALSEGIIADGRNAEGNVSVVRFEQTGESKGSDLAHVGAEYDVGQITASGERITSDIRNTVGHGNTRQVSTVEKSAIGYVGDSIRDEVSSSFTRRELNDGSLIAVKQHTSKTAVDGVERRNVYCGQGEAVSEHSGPNVRNTTANSDVGQRTTIYKKPVAQGGQSVG